MTIFTPRKEGHFPSYTKLINEQHRGETTTITTKKTFLKNALLLISNRTRFKKYEQSIFLHGEAQWKIAMLMRFLFPSTHIYLIFYYGFIPRSKAHGYIIEAFFFLLELLNLNCLGLEANLAKISTNIPHNIKNLHDPIPYTLKTATTSKNECKTFLISGYIDERKSIFESIEAVSRYAKESNQTAELILLGKQSDSVHKKLSQLNTQDNLITINPNNSFFSNTEQTEAIKQSDIVLAVYKKHYGSSGIVLTAIQQEKPVLFIPLGVLAGLAKELDFKHLPQTSDPIEIRSSITKVLEDSQFQYDKAKAQSSIRLRTHENFYNTIIHEKGNFTKLH